MPDYRCIYVPQKRTSNKYNLNPFNESKPNDFIPFNDLCVTYVVKIFIFNFFFGGDRGGLL